MSRGTSLLGAIRRHTTSFLNLFGRNDEARWNRSYAEGHWDFLDSLQQRPRHYVIAGMLRALGEDASRVLDVGCGTGALTAHLPGNVCDYVGLDVSSEAVRICDEKFGPSTAHTFVASAFEAYVPQEPFDVIVFNEMLYYYPVRRIPDVIGRARGLLAPGGSIVVSVHERSLKKRPVWKRLRTTLTPAEAMRAVDEETGRTWRIERYEVGSPLVGGP